MQQYLSEELEGCLEGNDVFAEVSSLMGETYRELEARRTFRFVANGRAYFAKVHYGVGWPEIFKNLLQLRLPVLGAVNEWRALNRLEELGIPAIEPVAYANAGWNPAKRRSCIVTRARENTKSLEDLCEEGVIDFPLRLRLIRKLALISRSLHENGINHRDYYVCHFLVDTDSLNETEPRLYLIDLHRAQIRSKTPRRWLVKDLGGLFFSAFDAGIGRRDLYRFIALYSGKPLRRALAEDRSLWQDVLARARRLYLQGHDALPAWVEGLGRG